jgi:hypothetical protein
MSWAEDYDLWLRIARKYNIYSIDQPLVLFRVHGSKKLSYNLDKVEDGSFEALRRNLNEESAALKREVLNKVYHRRANSRFYVGDYSVFRSHVIKISKYGKVRKVLWARFFISYFPAIIDFVRWIKKIIRRAAFKVSRS